MRSCCYHHNILFASRVALSSFVTSPISYEFHRLGHYHCLQSILSVCTGIHHQGTIPCSWDIQQGGYSRALINHPREGKYQKFVILLCCCRYSPARSGWKQFKWGILFSLTRFRSHSSSHSEKNSIFSVTHTKLISKHSQTTLQC